MCAAATRADQVEDARICSTSSGVNPNSRNRVDERLLAFVPGDELLDLLDVLVRHHRDPRRGLVQDELPQVACGEGGAQGDRRPVRVAEDAGRLSDRVDDGGNVLELALDRVLG